MKKLMVVIFVLIVLVVGNQQETDFTLLDYFSGTYTAYTTNGNCEGADLGFCYMNSKPATENLVGESIVVENFETSQALEVLNARVIKTEYLDNGTVVIYAFTNLINKKVKVDGRNVNVQIATNDERTVIGWPLILGSF